MILYITFFFTGGAAGYTLAVFSFAAKGSEVDLKSMLITKDLNIVLHCIDAELGSNNDARTLETLKNMRAKVRNAYQHAREL